jgi:hypothetical protein
MKRCWIISVAAANRILKAKDIFKKNILRSALNCLKTECINKIIKTENRNACTNLSTCGILPEPPLGWKKNRRYKTKKNQLVGNKKFFINFMYFSWFFIRKKTIVPKGYWIFNIYKFLLF